MGKSERKERNFLALFNVDPIQRSSKAHNELFPNFFTDFPDKIVGIDDFQGLKITDSDFH